MNFNREEKPMSDDSNNKNSGKTEKIISNEFMEFRRELSKTYNRKNKESEQPPFIPKESVFDYLNYSNERKKS